MQVFISWSGSRSRAVADLLDEWLQCVLQAIDPWMSSKDIDRGSLWFSEINDQLSNTKVGVVCLTKDNIDKPWILFESGALAKGLSSSRVCTLLIDLESTDVSNPLAQFNHTSPDKEGIFELVRTLNSLLAEKALKEKVLEQVFETYWPQFEEAFEAALIDNPAGEHDEHRTEESVLAEVLETTRMLDRRMRSMEKDERNSTIRHRTRKHIPMRTANILIESMLEQGIPSHTVMTHLDEIVPKRYLENRLNKFLNDDSRAHTVVENDESD